MPKTMPCPYCDTQVRVNKRYCPECNTVVNPNAPEDPIRQVQESADFKSIMMIGLGAMALFFSFGFFLPAMLAEDGFFWVAVPLFFVGIGLVLMSRLVKYRTAKKVARMKIDLHTKCDYCGGVNDIDIHQCTFCGAPLGAPLERAMSRGQ